MHSEELRFINNLAVLMECGRPLRKALRNIRADLHETEMAPSVQVSAAASPFPEVELPITVRVAARRARMHRSAGLIRDLTRVREVVGTVDEDRRGRVAASAHVATTRRTSWRFELTV